MTQQEKIILDADRRFPPVEESSTLIIGCHPTHYCASNIAKAVEDCNAHVLNLNVLAPSANAEGTAQTTIEVRVNSPYTASISRSLERYGYELLDVESSSDPDMDTMRDRVNELLHYLDL